MLPLLIVFTSLSLSYVATPEYPPTNAERVLPALVDTFRPNAMALRCIRRNARSIIDKADQIEREYAVPVGVLLVVAYLETHIGCTDGSGRLNWGAPASRNRRTTNGTAFNSASALRWSFGICRTWYRTISRYRGGFCRQLPRGFIGYTPRTTVHYIRQVYERAGLPLPDRLE